MSVSARERTVAVRPGEELDPGPILAFLRREMPGLPSGELEIRQFPSGSSNLTYLLRIDDWRAVLRRPPVGPVPPKAHDMEREAWILDRLHRAFPLAPRCLVVCNDPEVMEVPFHAMEYRKGVVIDTAFPPGTEVTEELCRDFGEAVLDALIELHAVDYRAAGLGELGHPEGFLERQTAGWIERYRRSRTDEIPEVDPLTEWLANHVPESPPPTLIHNDFHLKNLLFDPDDPLRILAVLDWEMTTVGDPLMDLAVFLGYWSQPDDPPGMQQILAPIPRTPGFPSRRELVERYARMSGRDVSRMDWYIPFAHFKLAVILQQIYARWVRGQTEDPRFAEFGTAVRQVVERAHALVDEAA